MSRIGPRTVISGSRDLHPDRIFDPNLMDGMGRGIEKPDLGPPQAREEETQEAKGLKDLEEEELLVVDAWG